ncbi:MULTISPECIES: helix-turn-helix transcriptional regulator [unclassified Streptomyces]|jgi:DNA-binding transcriptional ArsR family regulator|uniref:ArsR/SmtB family transcription factor n=1 Tax=unclassified Streptomyces TaxID=2593676 RepID=UPI00114D85A4|nr:helix-turn-helix transcriptional regulator [Streptomyces sp. SLBN-31]TQJ90118.1 ArsR family transcriptional regulator [Streptomyces sp. SLBN-31]
MRSQLYHPDRRDISLDKVLHALSDPIRRDIARVMHEEGSRSCGQLDYPIAKSTLSHHLKVLRESGVMHTEVRGTTRIITLRRDDLDARFPGLLDAVQVTAPAPEELPAGA